MDTPETLAAALLAAGGKAIVGTRAVVQKGALNVKNEAKANVQKSAPVHNARAHYAITYDTKIGATTVDAEIGYDKDHPTAGRSAKLGNLLEYGSRNNPPHRDLGRALDAEEPRFEQALAAMAMRLL